MEEIIAKFDLKDFVSNAPIQEGSKENFKVQDDGIYYYKHEYNYCKKLIIPKEVFIEAFEKYVLPNISLEKLLEKQCNINQYGEK